MFYGAPANVLIRVLLISLALLAASSGCKTPDPAHAQALEAYPHLASPDSALALLKRVESFAGGSVGVGAVVPPQALAFRTLLDEPDAAQQFARLLSEARPAGQLYALAGLHATSSEAYERAMPDFATRMDSVRTMFGCFVQDMAVSDVARDIGESEIVDELAGPSG